MTPDQVQQVVYVENKRLNEINAAKAQAYVQEIAAVNASIARLTETRAGIQKRIADLKFDSVTAADIVWDQSPA